MKPEFKLDKNQIKAINFGNGPLLIIAGAGTGKTTVITERINYLITSKNINPTQILALTFTEKAANEMQERVDVRLPYGYTNLWINTFHSFCDRVLRNDAHHIGIDLNYRLISESESILLLRKNIFNLGLNFFRPLGNPNKFLDSMLTHFSRLKDEDISPHEYLNWVKKQKSMSKNSIENDKKFELEQYLELAHAYLKYEEIKTQNSVMDFSDLISNTLLLFRKRPNILKKYQKQFSYILVDEFQDTNYAQNELAILLAGDDKNITVVADDDQSIYRFRGAAVSNVLQFKKNFPTAKIITLIDNHRSSQTILDAAYRLIQNNNPNRLEIVEKINKKLISHQNNSNSEIELINEKRAEDEAEKIAIKIKKLVKNNYNYQDIAILVRANNHAQNITSALHRNKIPYQFLGPGYLFQQEEIKDLMSYLFFLADLNDSVSLFRVLSMKEFNISNIELNYLLNFAKKKNLSLFKIISDDNLIFLKPETVLKLKEFVKMTEKHLEKIKKEQAGQILYYFLIDSKILETLKHSDSLIEEKRIQNIAKFFDRIKNFESEKKDSNIFSVVEWLSLMLQMGDSPQAADIDLRDENAVNILTVHSSKGLEFKVVFMVNLVEDRFPSRERSEKIPIPFSLIKEKGLAETDFHLEEERRLFYVGITRAKEKLFFTAADYYGAAKRIKKLSPFIFESNPEIKKNNNLTNPKAQQLSLMEILAPYEELKETLPEKNPIKISYITYSNLQMYDICPLHYKAKVILNIPTPPAAVQSFGISLHNTLYNFYKLVIENEKISLKIFKKILRDEWQDIGYINKIHEEERFKEANLILENFYKSECNPPIKPLAIEMPFSFILKNGVKVFGKIDRIDKTKNGIKIIDYKTGQDNPKADNAHKLQLAIYALAATKVKDPIFNNDPDKIILTLHFIEGNTKKSMTFNKDDLEKLENDLVEKIYEIEKSDFKCSANILCKNCEYKMLCNN